MLTFDYYRESEKLKSLKSHSLRRESVRKYVSVDDPVNAAINGPVHVSAIYPERREGRRVGRLQVSGETFNTRRPFIDEWGDLLCGETFYRRVGRPFIWETFWGDEWGDLLYGETFYRRVGETFYMGRPVGRLQVSPFIRLTNTDFNIIEYWKNNCRSLSKN